jgi:hypothetical protein
MRDIVSTIGTFYTGLTAAPTISATQTSGAVSLKGYDGAMIYIINPTASSAGTMTPVVQYTNDDGTGNPNSSGWTAVPNSDLVLWTSTSNTDRTPVKVGNAQPTQLTSSVALYQRVGYEGGVSGTSDYIRVVSTVASSWSAPYDVIIVLGRPRVMPASV